MAEGERTTHTFLLFKSVDDVIQQLAAWLNIPQRITLSSLAY
jgi:hypothetical protein